MDLFAQLPPSDPPLVLDAREVVKAKLQDIDNLDEVTEINCLQQHLLACCQTQNFRLKTVRRFGQETLTDTGVVQTASSFSTMTPASQAPPLTPIMATKDDESADKSPRGSK